ncbi:protein unc-93 homolog A-like [Amphiura filiformis]|uniref:protein unc-93 homolog A-like n=1 Tax=Amphiura filiformis TaxID=82378 RepID=UPI003B224636
MEKKKYEPVPLADKTSLSISNNNVAHTEDTEDHFEEDWGKKKILRNLIIVSAAFFLLFTAFQGLSNLQSSINCDHGLGVASLATIFGTITFSALFVPSFVIKHISIKWTLVTSMCCYTIYYASNFYPTWYTLIPPSVLLGLSGAPLWAAQSTYLTTVGIKYSLMTKETRDVVVSRFFGIFFLFFQASQVLGNLISSLVFSHKQDADETTQSSFECGSIMAMTCQSGDSGYGNTTSICEETKPPKDLTNIVIALYTGCGACSALLIVFCLDPIKQSTKNKNRDTMELVGATLGLMMDRRVMLLIPLTIFNGLEQAYVQGDFTKSFVTCKIGIQWVGYVMIFFGVVDAATSFIAGRVEKYTGRIPQFTLAAVANVVLMIVMVVWEPTDDKPVYFIIAGLWGFSDAIWQTQMNAYYGVLFPYNQEPAFSNYRLWQSAGFTMSFAYSNFLCIWTKCLVLTLFLFTGMAGYYVTELKRRIKTPRGSMKSRASFSSLAMFKWKKAKDEELHVGNYLGTVDPVDL